jgi:Lipid A 3-O-deacylase (PagL)
MRRPVALVVILLLVGVPAGVRAFDAEQTLTRGGYVLSLEGGGGSQSNLEGLRERHDLDMAYAGVRLSLLPFGTFAKGHPLYGAVEVGLEPIYQQYPSPSRRYYAGLGLEFKYHFLALGRFAPYFEILGAAGSTDLKTRDINSPFAFLLFGGAGAEYFITDRLAIYAGYRLEHVSNAHLYSRNRGFEANTGMAGVSVFFP